MSGHIRRRGTRSWGLKFDVGADVLTGKRATKYHSFKGSKRDAQAELIRLMDAAAKGTYVDPSKATLGEFLGRWERDWAVMNVSPKTLERYQELLKVHVHPRLGALPVQKLQPAHLAELYGELCARDALREARKPRQDSHRERLGTFIACYTRRSMWRWSGGWSIATWRARRPRRRLQTPRSKSSPRIRPGLFSSDSRSGTLHDRLVRTDDRHAARRIAGATLARRRL